MDVRRTKAESVQEARLELLKERYKNYTSFHEGYNTELKMLKGMLFQHCILLLSHFQSLSIELSPKLLEVVQCLEKATAMALSKLPVSSEGCFGGLRY